MAPKKDKSGDKGKGGKAASGGGSGASKAKNEKGTKKTSKRNSGGDERDTKVVAANPFDDVKVDDSDRLTSGFSLIVGNTISGSIDTIVVNGFSIGTGKSKVLFQDASISLTFGKKYGVVGKNGIGKSTLLKHLVEKKLPVHPDMDILYVEQEVEASQQSALQVVLQSNKHRVQLWEKLSRLRAQSESEDHEIADAVDWDELEKLEGEWKDYGYDSSDYEARRILNGLGFKREEQDQAIELFSGGWRMRIALAQALFRQPTVLMLDEPSNHLDLNAVIWLIDYLIRYKKTVVLVSHDIHFLNEVCTDMVHIADKKCYQYSGNYDKFVKSRKKLLANQSKEWEKVEKKVKEMKKKGTPRKDVDSYLANCGVSRPEKEYVVNMRFANPGKINGVAVDCRDVNFSYDGKVIFKDMNFAVSCESRIAIVGPNGVGKSTLLRLMIGDLNVDPETGGEVRRNAHVRIGYYSQHFASTLPEDITPLQYLLSLYTKYADDDDDDDKDDDRGMGRNKEQNVRKLLGTIGLEGELHKEMIGKLSGGQKARVAFVSLFVTKPHILLLDEPSNHLDLETLEALIEAINEFDGGVVLVSHDIELISKTDCLLFNIADNSYTIKQYPGEYEQYRDEVLSHLNQSG
jgi:ATP-binding cassette subfamily F protein 1